MKSLIVFIFLVTILGCSSEHEVSTSQSIYGRDDRKDIFEESNPSIRTWSRSVVAMIKEDAMKGDQFTSETLGQKFRLCESERFKNQASLSGCTGFLVAPDVIATSGHCIKDQKECQSTLMVFDYAYNSNDANPLQVRTSNIYRCREILDRAYGGSDKSDYALLRLDRAVQGREPLRLQSANKISDNASLLAIGTPAGLPLKVSGGARVFRNNADAYFEATLDAFGGQSGGPVFDASTGLVEGVLVRGRSDFNIDGACTSSYTYSDNPDSAEDVTRASLVAKALAQKVPSSLPNPSQPTNPNNPNPTFPNPTFPNPTFPGTSRISWSAIQSACSSIAQNAAYLLNGTAPEVARAASQVQYLAYQAAMVAQREGAANPNGWGADGFLQAQGLLLGSAYDLLSAEANRWGLSSEAAAANQRIAANIGWIRNAGGLSR